MKILVTGSTGYLGRSLMNKLKAVMGAEIYVIARAGSDVSFMGDENIHILRADLAVQSSIERALASFTELDVLYHVAAATSGSHYESMINTVIATNNLLNALKNCCVKRFVLVSSFSVYQMTELASGSILDENTPIETKLSLRDSYAQTKVKQEKLVRKFCCSYKIPLVIVRPGKIYGSDTYMIPPQLGLRIPGLCFLIPGGDHLIPFTHVENCADAVFLAGTFGGPNGECVINIVDDDLMTQKDFLKVYRRIHGRMPRSLRVPDFIFRGMVKLFEIASKISKGNIPPLVTRYRSDNLWKPLRYDNSRAKRMLGWKPEISIKTGIKNALESIENT